MITVNWASDAIASLRHGESCRLQAYGNSMRPRILSGSTVTLEPRTRRAPIVGDVVLVDVGAHTTLHRVCEFGSEVHGERKSLVLIADERGNPDGWVDVEAIHGVVVEITPPPGRV